jgi:hypothetical protein
VFTRLRVDPRTQGYDERRTKEGNTRRESSVASNAMRPGRSSTWSNSYSQGSAHEGCDWMIPLFGEPEVEGKRDVLEGRLLGA